MAPHKHQFKRRPRRASTPTPTTILHIKSPSASTTNRQMIKKQRLRKTRTNRKSVKRASSPQALVFVGKDVKERLMQIAQETQRIVFGDGQYVEERRVSNPCALAHRIEGFSMDPLGQVDSSPFATFTVAHNISEQVQRSCLGTTFYPHHSPSLADWATPPAPTSPKMRKLKLRFVRQSTLLAARQLAQHAPRTSPGVGVLSSASRKRPGSRFSSSNDDQEGAIARLSSLAANLSSPAAKEFYSEHQHFWTQDGSGFHDRSMVYSPGVVVFRTESDDNDSSDSLGGSFISPYHIDVLSVVPVNAAVVRDRYSSVPERESDEAVRRSMKERIARALRVFEERGNRHLVLGAFGCSGGGSIKLDIVADIWAELLVCGDMEGEGGSKRAPRFKNSFDTVVFAVPGKSLKLFRDAFEMRLFEGDLINTLISD